MFRREEVCTSVTLPQTSWFKLSKALLSHPTKELNANNFFFSTTCKDLQIEKKPPVLSLLSLLHAFPWKEPPRGGCRLGRIFGYVCPLIFQCFVPTTIWKRMPSVPFAGRKVSFFTLIATTLILKIDRHVIKVALIWTLKKQAFVEQNHGIEDNCVTLQIYQIDI